MGKRHRLCLLAAAICLLAGCLPSADLRQAALVQLVAVDKGGQGYQLTLQLYIPDSDDGEHPGTVNQLLQLQGGTLAAALQSAQTQLGRPLFFGDCRVLLIGRQAAQDSLEAVLRFFSADPQLSPGLPVLVCQGEAAAAAVQQPQGEYLSGAQLAELYEGARAQGAVGESTLKSLCEPFYLSQEGSCAAGLQLEEGAASLSGSLLLWQGQPAGWLDPQAAQGLWLLSGRAGQLQLAVEDAGGRQALLMLERVRVQWRYDPSLGLRAQVRARAHLLEGDGWEGETALRQLEQAAQAQLQGQLQRAWQQSCAQGVDAVLLARWMRQQHPAVWQSRQADWPQFLAGQPFEAECRVVLQSGGLQGVF